MNAAGQLSPSPVVAALAEVLEAQMEALLLRPVCGSLAPAAPADLDPVSRWVGEIGSPRSEAFRLRADGSCRVAVSFDVGDQWRGREKELMEKLQACVDEQITFLTPAQAQLMRGAPRELLRMRPPPASAVLLDIETLHVGGREVPVALIIDELPLGAAHCAEVAVLPNLVPLQRMAAAVELLRSPRCPERLAPLCAFVGIGQMPDLEGSSAPAGAPAGAGLDADQVVAVERALQTPHFASVVGPPGSGKTTLIRALIAREVALGHRILLVSPTHVAVDNVVEKLWPAGGGGTDPLSPHTLPARWASRPDRVAPGAQAALEGPRANRRPASIAERVEACLRQNASLDRLWKRLDPSARSELGGVAPLTAALCQRRQVLCGTPIGLLSAPDLAADAEGEFDLLIVDEASKITLPELLAIAVHARRWVLVGDPAQLPPYLDPETAGAALSPTYGVDGELVASLSALIEAAPPADKGSLRAVVLASRPAEVAAAARSQLQTLCAPGAPPVWSEGEPAPVSGIRAGVIVCSPKNVSAALSRFAGDVRVLVEPGVTRWRPGPSSGARLVEVRDRAPARLAELCQHIVQVAPWAAAAGVRPPSLGRRKGLPRLMPHVPDPVEEDQLHAALCARFAVLSLSAFDWLRGLDGARWPDGPLAHLDELLDATASVRTAAARWSSILRTQYRMVPGLSRVPRELFYGGVALLDGRIEARPVGPVLRQVHGAVGEENENEVSLIVQDLIRLGAAGPLAGTRVMVITPYRAQEALLERRIRAAAALIGGVDVEICTFDRCQGREADVVLLSLVRSRCSPFLDNPKRWNVALTRARDHLVIYGDIASLRAQEGRRDGDGGPRRGVLATVLHHLCA